MQSIALIALLCVLAGCAAQSVRSPPVPQASTSTSAERTPGVAGSTHPPSTDPHAAATIDHVDAVLAQTPQFPGAVALSAPPSAEFADAPTTFPASFVRRTGWWTSTLTPDEFPGWLQAHLPATWSLTGGALSSPGTWGPHVLLDQYSAGPRSDATWTYSAVNVFWGPSGTGTAVRVSAQAYWVASRPDGELIADGATTVDVRVFVPDRAVFTTAPLPATVHRTITGSDAVAVRTTVNSLHPWTDTGTHGCLSTLGMTDVLTFREGGRTTVVTTHDGGCTGTDFVVDHHTLPPLEDSVLHQQLVQLLHLPEGHLTDW